MIQQEDPLQFLIIFCSLFLIQAYTLWPIKQFHIPYWGRDLECNYKN